MKIKIISLVAISAFIVFAAIILALNFNNSGDIKQSECITIFTLDDMGVDGRQYMEKMRKQDFLPSASLQNNFIPVSGKFNTRFDENTYLLGIDQEKDEIFVNADYFSDIVKTDATSIEDATVIGKYKQLAFDKQSPRAVIEFLLKSHFVATYWHLRSEICLIKEKNTADIYVADFYASHDYCTNKCVTENYKFSMEINKNDGTITILPGQ